MTLEYLLYLTDALIKKTSEPVKISKCQGRSFEEFIEQAKKQLDENNVYYMDNEEFKDGLN